MQIRIAFEQSQKEVDDLRQRTKEGLVTARLNGKAVGRQPGQEVTSAKEAKMKALMRKKLKSFGGHLSDKEFLAMTHDGETISHNTFYKY